NITNIDTNTYSNIPGSSITFINNQLGYLEFNCASLDSGIGLLPNDVFEGKIKITMFSTKTDLEKISSGEIRVRIEG
ncbi:MAG: hypothetical protein KC550_08060, partial [Nanoarchaeota archaeon]|nr:hypothetical protein [Nanoarchaeota archaeon]